MRAAQVEAEQLQAGGEDAADQDRADQREQRRVRRRGALLEQQRPEPRAEERPAGEADERQRSDDQALGVTPDGHEHREARR